MDVYEKILVYALGTFLAVFLILGIIVLVNVIKVVKKVNELTERASQLANKAEAIGDFFERASGPLIIGKVLANFADVFKKKKKRG